MELRTLHAASQECDPFPIVPALLPATAIVVPRALKPKASLTQLSHLTRPEKGRAAPVSKVPLSNYICERTVKNTTFKIRTQTLP